MFSEQGEWRGTITFLAKICGHDMKHVSAFLGCKNGKDDVNIRIYRVVGMCNDYTFARITIGYLEDWTTKI
jgi:hypothetical protein